LDVLTDSNEDKAVFTNRAMATCSVLMVLLGAGVAGCLSSRQQQLRVSDAIETYQSAHPVHGQPEVERPVEVGVLRKSPAAQPAGLDLPKDADVGTFVGLAVRRNPRLRAARDAVLAKMARVPQVTALPDPVVQSAIRAEPVRTAAGDIYLELRASQTFPVPAKLDERGWVALEEARSALEKLRSAHNQVIAETKGAYYRLYYAHQSIAVTKESRKLLREIQDNIQARLRAGTALQSDALRAQLELSNLENELLRLAQTRDTAIARLNLLIDRAPDAPFPVPSRPEAGRITSQLDALVTAAAENHPDLRQLQHQMERDRHAVRLARLGYWPDFTLGFFWTLLDPRGAFEPPPNPETGIVPPTPQLSERGTDSWGILLGMTLPIWSEKVEAGIREARHRRSETAARLHDERNRVYFDIQDRLLRVQTGEQLVDLFSTTIIPQARQTFEVSRTAYAAGRVDFLTLEENWRKLLDAQLLLERSLSQLEQDFAALEQAVGQELSQVRQPGTQPAGSGPRARGSRP